MKNTTTLKAMLMSNIETSIGDRRRIPWDGRNTGVRKNACTISTNKKTRLPSKKCRTSVSSTDIKAKAVDAILSGHVTGMAAVWENIDHLQKLRSARGDHAMFEEIIRLAVRGAMRTVSTYSSFIDNNSRR